MKKLFLFFFISILSLTEAQAQLGYGKLEDVQQIKQVPLLVVLLSPNDKTVKKLEKKKGDDLKKYVADIEAYNTSVKNAFNSSWSFSREIKFITDEELQKLDTRENEGKYAYFKQLIEGGNNSLIFEHLGTFTTYNYAIYLTGKRKPVFSYMYTTILPNEADFKFLAQQIQIYLTYREIFKTKEKSRKELLSELKAKAPLLKQKTLLLEEEILSPAVLRSLDKIYPYPYRLVNKEEIDKAILSDAKDIAYLKILPIGQITDTEGLIKSSSLVFMQYVINAENGEYLAYVTPSPLIIPGVTGSTAQDRTYQMRKNDLLEIVEAIEKDR